MEALIFRSRKALARAGVRQVARLGLAACIMAVWGLAALFSIANGFLTNERAKAASASSASSAPVSQATVGPNAYSSATFYQVLSKAAEVCPAGKSIPIFTNYAPAYNLGNYHLYPRKLIQVQASDPFDSVTLDTYSKACLLTYGDSGAHHVAQFESQLEPVTCSFDGCLYMAR